MNLRINVVTLHNVYPQKKNKNKITLRITSKIKLPTTISR